MNQSYQQHGYPPNFAQTAQAQQPGYPQSMNPADLAALQQQGFMQQQQQLAAMQQQRMAQAQAQAMAAAGGSMGQMSMGQMGQMMGQHQPGMHGQMPMHGQMQPGQGQAQGQAQGMASLQALQGMGGVPNMAALQNLQNMQAAQGMQGMQPPGGMQTIQAMQMQAAAQAQMQAMQTMQGAMGAGGMATAMGGMGTPGSSSSKKKKHHSSRTPAQQLLGRQAAHLSGPPGAEHYRQNAMLPPGHAQAEPWADALDELDPREMAMGRFRARQEILSEVFGPDDIKSIPTEGPDPWAGLGMEGETLQQRIEQLEAENAELERQFGGTDEELWRGLGEDDVASIVPAATPLQSAAVVA